MKALVLENIHQSAVSVLESRGYEVELRSGAMSEAELLHALEDVSLLGIRSNTTVSRRRTSTTDVGARRRRGLEEGLTR